MKKIIDVRGLDCPKPVLETKHALNNPDFDTLEIIVDNAAARDNVKRFLSKSGYENTRINQLKSDFVITVDLGKKADLNPDTTQSNSPEPKKENLAKTIFISSNVLGEGSDELGTKLMKAFTFTLTEQDNPPQRLLFMNSGVFLCLESAETLPNIKKLHESGVDILVCGACLNFFGKTEELAVGRISNMYEITEHLLSDPKVIKI